MNKVSLFGESVSVLTSEDAGAWRRYLPADQSVFGSVEYARIVEAHTGNPARLFVLEDGEGCVVYPFFLRQIADLPFQTGPEARWDIYTPEYSGPLCMGKLTQQTVLRFRQAFSRYCRQEGIISEFAHLHPWHSCTALLMRDGIAFNREIVYVDLNASTRELWLTHLNHACKKNIKRSLNEKVEVFAATTADEIGEFYRIYTATMERNGAAPSYFFPLSYFIAFHATMPKNAQFMLAAYEGKIIAGTLYLYDRHDIYSYLGGADHEYQQVRPTNAVIYHTIRWGQWQTMSRLILGGGYEPDDGIFRFKATFSPLRANFFTYKRIHRRRSYTQLCESWAAQYGETIDGSTFFPAYRSQPEK